MQTADFRTYAEAKPRTRALRGPDGGGCWHAWWQTQPRGDITHDGTGRGGAQGACNHSESTLTLPNQDDLLARQPVVSGRLRTIVPGS